jgi:hypothetical protein
VHAIFWRSGNSFWRKAAGMVVRSCLADGWMRHSNQPFQQATSVTMAGSGYLGSAPTRYHIHDGTEWAFEIERNIDCNGSPRHALAQCYALVPSGSPTPPAQPERRCAARLSARPNDSFGDTGRAGRSLKSWRSSPARPSRC